MSHEWGLLAEGPRRLARRLGYAWQSVVSVRGPGTAAILHAADLVRSGHATAALACAYDCLQEADWAGLSSLGVTAQAGQDPARALRPFDADRSGTVFSEGAGCLLLESAQSVRGRRGQVVAEVLGGAASRGAGGIGPPDSRGRALATTLRLALEDAQVDADEVDYVSAHGDGTLVGDVAEARALHAVFGERAPEMPVTSLKGALGYALSAAGALESVVSVMTLRGGVIPPTLNHDSTDEECALNVVRKVTSEYRVRTMLSTACAVGGGNAVLVLRKAPTNTAT